MNQQEFTKSYMDFILPLGETHEGKKKLKTPHPTPPILLNWRPWENYQVFKHGDFKPSDTVLTVGDMHTYYCLYLSKFVSSITVTDSFYWSTRDYYKQNVDAYKLTSVSDWSEFLEKTSDNLVVLDEDIQCLQFEDESFNKVVSVSVMEHVKDDATGFRELYRVLTKGGCALITTEYDKLNPKDYSESDGSWYRVYNKESIDRVVLGAGFKIEYEEVDRDSGRSNLFILLRKPLLDTYDHPVLEITTVTKPEVTAPAE